MTYTSQRMHALIEELNKASALYYTLGESPMSDAEWDAKYNELLTLEKESGTILPGSPTVRVGAEPLTGFVQHRHISRLWSMDKVQSKEELLAWIKRTEKQHEQLTQPLVCQRVGTARVAVGAQHARYADGDDGPALRLDERYGQCRRRR